MRCVAGRPPENCSRRARPKTQGGTRYYDTAQLLGLGEVDAPTICYARVSSHDRKADLDRQQEILETYCAAKGWRTEVIRDLGSGMNDRKKGLQRLLEMIQRRQMRRLVSPTRIGCYVVIADRWFPSSKTCHACGQLHDMPLSQRTLVCDCGHVMDRDLNAAKNLDQYGRDALRRDLKRTQEPGQTGAPALALTT